MAAANWASQRVLSVLPLAQAEARRMGFTFDKAAPGYPSGQLTLNGREQATRVVQESSVL